MAIYETKTTSSSSSTYLPQWVIFKSPSKPFHSIVVGEDPPALVATAASTAPSAATSRLANQKAEINGVGDDEDRGSRWVARSSWVVAE